MLAICVVALFGFVALAIDLGMMMVSRTECQNAADAAALVGARTLDNDVPPGVHPDDYNNSKPEAEANSRTAITSNIFLNTNFTETRIEAVRVGLYDYDYDVQQFKPTFPVSKPSGKAWSAVEVVVNGDQPAYFGRIFGITTMPMSARAVAVHRPRDIAMVIDFTGSMGYGTTFTYDSGSRATQSTYRKIFNSSDPSYPQFGHYARYLEYTNNNPSGNQKNSTVSGRPHPLYQTGTVVQAPYVYSPANITVTTDNGPPLIRDFRYDPVASGSTVTTAELTNAFHAGSFSTTRSWFGTTLIAGPTPAPENFKDQTDSPVPFLGDKWPRKWGFVPTSDAEDWAVTSTNGAAIHVAELLGRSARYTGGSSVPAINFANASGRDSNNYRDAVWERYGYDLNIAHYVNNRGNWDPRWDWNIDTASWQHQRTSDPATTFRPQLKAPELRFKGYTMGPGYWGKTFFIWPPDPRTPVGNPGDSNYVPGDWRQRYFGTTDNEDLFTAPSASTNGGNTLRSGIAPNYSAILAWIKSGPEIFPPNLRSGRVLYYSSIPSDVNTNEGTTAERNDKRFWRAYIDFVLNSDPTEGRTLAGVEPRGWPEGVRPIITEQDVLTRYDMDGSGSLSADPRPYMRYTDNPCRPRMHLWFGPISLYGYIDYRNFISGTMHQAQSWQLKAGVSSALDDIRANHPNDLVGLAFFTKTPGNTSRSYREPVVPLGQDWRTLKNSLYFPRSLLPDLDIGSITAEIRPYDSNVNYNGHTDIPNAQANTDPNTGLMMAFNILAPSQYTQSNSARRGRRGASKIVIFETDGVPNSAQNGTLTPAGYDTYYRNIGGNHPSYSDNQTGGTNAAYAVVNQIVKPMATNNNSSVDSGMSLPNAPARVYAIGFGDIFDTSLGPTTANFLLEIQKRGGTSKPTDSSIPSYQIITGSYQTRIANLRTALERIFQSGVQVTLIE